VGSELTGLFETLIEGTEDWNQELNNVLKSLSKILLNAGLNLIGSQNKGNLFGQLLGFRANGGPVSAGSPYIVGEKGPELFTPSTSGNITPNDALGGSTVVNITVNDNGGGTASGSGPNQKNAAQLARLIESSTLAIINREKRPGGTLSLSR
jgi:phage-related minor tail protein